jgi:hypothetical protein
MERSAIVVVILETINILSRLRSELKRILVSESVIQMKHGYILN